jgi:uncharacterized membrane protein
VRRGAEYDRARHPPQEERVTLASITTYEVYLAVHILAAVIWVGGALAVQVFAARATASGSGERIATISKDIEWLGTRVFIPSSLLLVVFGFLLISEGNWDYESWVVFGLAVWAASFLVGSGFLGPESGRISKAFAAEGSDSADGHRRLRRIFLISRIELALLILVVLAMALKP